jgi:hypothetical protein
VTSKGQVTVPKAGLQEAPWKRLCQAARTRDGADEDGGDHGADAWRLVVVLVDTNVLLDVLQNDPQWASLTDSLAINTSARALPSADCQFSRETCLATAAIFRP